MTPTEDWPADRVAARIEINERITIKLSYALAGALNDLKFTTRGHWSPFRNHNTGQRGLVTLNDEVIGEFTHPADAEHAAAWPPSRIEKLVKLHLETFERHRMMEDGLNCSCGIPDHCLWPCVQIEPLIEFWLEGEFAFITPDTPPPVPFESPLSRFPDVSGSMPRSGAETIHPPMETRLQDDLQEKVTRFFKNGYRTA